MCDLLDRLALDEVLASYPRNRLHDKHPQPPASFESRQPNRPTYRGSILDADPPAQGVNIAGRMTPERLHDEITADYNDMIYAATREEIEVRRKAFIRKWRLKHRAVADSLEEAGERLFAFTRLPPSQWRSVRTTNAIERVHEEFKRRIKTQNVLPFAV